MAARGTAVLGNDVIAMDAPLFTLSQRLDAVLDRASAEPTLRRAASPARALPPLVTAPIRATPFTSPVADAPRSVSRASSASRLANAASQTLSIAETAVQTESAATSGAATTVTAVTNVRVFDLSSDSLSPTAANASPLDEAVRALDARLAASERHDTLSHAFAAWCDVFSRRPLATQSPVFAFAMLRWLRHSWGVSDVDSEGANLLQIVDGDDIDYDARVARNEAASGAAYGFALPLQRPSLLASTLDVSRITLLRWTMRAWSARVRRVREFSDMRTRGCALRAISALRLHLANANAREFCSLDAYASHTSTVV